MTSHDRDLDALIDQVAREMTDGRVEASLAERVSRRLDEPFGGRTPLWRRPWMLAPAAACVIAVAAFVMRETRQPAPVRQAPASALAGPDALPEAAGPPALTTAARGGEPGPTDTPRARLADAPTARPVIQPLTVAPIDVEREVVTPLRVSPLVVVMPIEISAIAIDRIEIPPMP